jgi:hypothetical protein
MKKTREQVVAYAPLRETSVDAYFKGYDYAYNEAYTLGTKLAEQKIAGIAPPNTSNIPTQYFIPEPPYSDVPQLVTKDLFQTYTDQEGIQDWVSFWKLGYSDGYLDGYTIGFDYIMNGWLSNIENGKSVPVVIEPSRVDINGKKIFAPISTEKDTEDTSAGTQEENIDQKGQFEFENNQQQEPSCGIVGDCGPNQVWNQSTCKCEEVKKEESNTWKYVLGIGTAIMVGGGLIYLASSGSKNESK